MLEGEMRIVIDCLEGFDQQLLTLEEEYCGYLRRSQSLIGRLQLLEKLNDLLPLPHTSHAKSEILSYLEPERPKDQV